MKSLTTLRSRSIIAFVLIAWCAGMGCLAVSFAHERAAVDSAPVKANPFGNISASAGSGSSCHSHQQVSKKIFHRPQTMASGVTLSEAPTSREASSCCPLMSASFVTAASNHSNEGQTTSLARHEFVLRSPNSSWQKPVAGQLLLRNRDQTYLQVCSLLI